MIQLSPQIQQCHLQKNAPSTKVKKMGGRPKLNNFHADIKIGGRSNLNNLHNSDREETFAFSLQFITSTTSW